MIRPYWTSPDGTIVVYNERWEDVLAAGLVQVRDVALIHDDPPYGVSERTDRKSKGRSNVTSSIDFAPVVGDEGPYDVGPVLALHRPLVTWGANHYAVPPSPSWIIWDKREGGTSDDNADGEAAWTNLGGPLRIVGHKWRGMIKASERGSKRMHPTQKPIALSRLVFELANLQRGDLVFVPHMGSGPDLPACLTAGLRCIAVEVSRAYCDTAVARLGAVTAERAAEPVGSLFAPRGTP